MDPLLNWKGWNNLMFLNVKIRFSSFPGDKAKLGRVYLKTVLDGETNNYVTCYWKLPFSKSSMCFKIGVNQKNFSCFFFFFIFLKNKVKFQSLGLCFYFPPFFLSPGMQKKKSHMNDKVVVFLWRNPRDNSSVRRIKPLCVCMCVHECN